MIVLIQLNNALGTWPEGLLVRRRYKAFCTAKGTLLPGSSNLVGIWNITCEPLVSTWFVDTMKLTFSRNGMDAINCITTLTYRLVLFTARPRWSGFGARLGLFYYRCILRTDAGNHRRNVSRDVSLSTRKASVISMEPFSASGLLWRLSGLVRLPWVQK